LTTRRHQKLRQKHEQRFIYILPNLEEEEDEETPYKVKISSDLWAHAMAGGPFTSDEIRELREKYKEEVNE